MAFQDIFEETRKKLSGYFGVGRPGLGTFGQQVKNTFKPVANLATRKLPSFNAFNTASNFARQQMPRFQGAVSNIARSQVQREIRPRINAVRNTVNLADNLASRGIDKYNTWERNLRTRAYGDKEARAIERIPRLGVRSTVAPMIQGTARSVASLVPAITKKPIQVNTSARRALFGNQYQDIQKPTIEGIRQLQDTGFNESTSKKYGPAFGVAMTALDVIPGMGGKDDLVKGLVKATTKSGVKKLLPKVADDVAETIAKTTDAKAIRNLIKPQKVADALSNEARKIETFKQEARKYGADVEFINRKPTKSEMLQGKYKQGKIQVYLKDIKGNPKSIDEIEKTVNHEIGHHIDYGRRGIVADPMGDSIKGYDGKLRPARDSDIYFRNGPKVEEAKKIRELFPRNDGYSSTQKEIYADAYALYRKDPDTLKSIAPNIYKDIDNHIGSLSPQSTPSALSNEARKLYHGSNTAGIEQFDSNLSKRVDGKKLDALGRGVYLTADQKAASGYGKNIYNVNLKSNNIVDLEKTGKWVDDNTLKGLAEKLNSLGIKAEYRGNGMIGTDYGLIDNLASTSVERVIKNASKAGKNGVVENALDSVGIDGLKMGDTHLVFNPTKTEIFSPQSTQGVKKTAKAEAEFQKVSDELLDRPIPKNNVKVMNPTAQMADEALGKSETLKGNYKNILGEWVNNRNVAKTRGAQKVLETNIPYDEAQATIKGLEGTGAHTGTSQMFRQQFDEAYKAAQDAGLDVGYIDDYLTHIWKEDPKIVKEKFAAVTQNFKFSEGRTIPTYEEGIKLGLKPKYDTPQQILGHYTQKLEEVKANIGFFNRLKDEGFIVPASVGANNPSFKAITGAGFPKSTSYVGKNSRVIGAWYAPREIADDIDKVFGIKESPKWLETTAKISGGAQDLLLSGGIPKTPLNAFTFAQITKEVLGGNYKSPLKSFATALSGQKTNKFLADNVEQIVKMQKNGINLRSSFGLEDLADRGTIKNVFGSSIGEGWDKFMSDPTFKRFMPMLQINMFNAVERGAIKAGRSADEAAQVAAQAVKNFYGLNDAAKEVTRSKVTNNLLTTFAFAPKYRESMINFWINNVKAIKSPLAPENRNNVIFGLGAIVTYAGMDQANLAINGVHMKDNPKGKEDKLLIPLGNGKTVGIPYLSSIATVPRSAYRAGKALYEGDIKGAVQEGLKSNLSAGLKPLVEVAANENYFGEEIYDDYDTTGQKWGKIANYLVNPATGAYGHPYIREGVKYAQKKQGVAETVSKATEMPLRWYNTKSIENAGFWEANDTQKQISEIEKQAKYGKIPAQMAQKQIQSLTSKRDKQLTKPTSNVAKADSGQDSRIRDLGGYYGITTSKGTDFADTYEDAQKALAKDDFDKSGKKSATINGTYFYRKENGDIGSYTEAELNFKVRDQQMEKAKENNNYGAWAKLAQEKQKDLEQQWKDADGDPLAQLEIENKLIDHYQNMAKYASYGGFKKGKKGKKIKFSAFDSSTTSGIKIPISKATKPNFKKITSTPKIPVSTKARGITKSYLANLR